MSIPGYDHDDVEEFVLERAGARVAVVAGVVPDDFGIASSTSDPPADALSEPIDVDGIDEVKAIEAIRITLAYDPSALPAGASPTDVAVAVETDEGRELLLSEVDLEETTVSASLADRLPGETIVAVATRDDETTVENDEDGSPDVPRAE